LDDDDEVANDSTGTDKSRISYSFEEKMGMMMILAAIFRIFHSTPNESEKAVGRDELLGLMDKTDADFLLKQEGRHRRDTLSPYLIAEEYVKRSSMRRDAEADGINVEKRYTAARINSLWKTLSRALEVSVFDVVAVWARLM
jgi:hypothetical protein